MAPEEGVGGVRINAVTSKCDDIVFFILIDFSRLPSEFMSTFVVINFSGNTMISVNSISDDFQGDSIVVAPEEGVGGVRINAVTSKCDDIVY